MLGFWCYDSNNYMLYYILMLYWSYRSSVIFGLSSNHRAGGIWRIHLPMQWEAGYVTHMGAPAFILVTHSAAKIMLVAFYNQLHFCDLNVTSQQKQQGHFGLLSFLALWRWTDYVALVSYCKNITEENSVGTTRIFSVDKEEMLR